jgi:hypothetical protein
MLHRRRRRFVVADATVLAIVAALVLVLALTSSRSSGPGDADVVLTVSAPTRARAIPAGFLGLSLEYPAIEQYAGADPLAIDPVFEQLIRNLTPGQAPVLRIGGDSADWTWWPLSGVSAPPGVRYALSPRWAQVTHALAAALDARLILGINLEADSLELAGGEAGALVNGIGRGAVQALELGNEPELYGAFPWYRAPDGRGVTGRPVTYNFSAFRRDFAQFSAVLPHVMVAGPTVSGPGWLRHLAQFLTAEPQVGLVTLHRYPLQLCFTSRSSPRYPTIAHLLAPAASAGLARTFAPYVAVAHARGLPLRVDELNTVSCGADPAVSETFASALWVLDTLFEMAGAGVDGVNIHTFPGAGYELFHLGRVNGRWRGSVAPEYYGLLAFARAAPPGSRLLRVGGARKGQVRAWATRAPDGRIRVVLINDGIPRVRGVTVAVRVPRATGLATLEWLRAPGITASTAVTIGGQSFGSQTATGTLQGPLRALSVTPASGRYAIRLPPASAAVLTLVASGR